MPRCPVCKSPVPLMAVWRSFDCLFIDCDPVRCAECGAALVPVRRRARLALAAFAAVTLAGFEAGRALADLGFSAGLGMLAGIALAWILAVAGISVAGLFMRYHAST